MNRSDALPIALRAAREVDVPVYVLMLGGVDRAIQGKRFAGSPLRNLAEIAEQTGGRSFLIDGPQAALDAAARIRDDLRHQYWLAFRPSKAPDGRFRPLTVKGDRRGAKVLTRAGYR